jgi:hypothetical protein
LKMLNGIVEDFSQHSFFSSFFQYYLKRRTIALLCVTIHHNSTRHKATTLEITTAT